MADREQDLMASIEQYKLQLGMVIQQLTADDDNSDLLTLQTDLLELITLTEDDLLNVKKQKLLARVQMMSGENESNDAGAGVEIPEENPVIQDDKDREESCSSSPESLGSPSLADDQLNQLESKLRELEGTKCRVPFGQDWGHHTHHNALVLNAEPVDLESGQLMVRVVFCHPTHRNMLICPYYLDGQCRFSDEVRIIETLKSVASRQNDLRAVIHSQECRYSHGHVISVGDLHQYQEPDYSLVESGSRVLAKYRDGLWYPATVETVETVEAVEAVESGVETVETVKDTEGEMTIRFDSYDDVVSVKAEEVVPLGSNDSGSSSESEEQLTDDEDSAPVYLYKPKQTTEKLGDWEQHTKGIGSKLMLKMGYRMGDGLGCRGQGRAEPVPIQLLPLGKSLDRIMELKQLAQDGELFDAEKKEKRRRAAILKKAAEAYNKKTEVGVFDFINNKLLKGKKGNLEALKSLARGEKSGHRLKSISERDLSQKSDRGLNVQLFRTEEEIRKVQIEIDKIRESIARNQNSSSFQNQAKEKLRKMEAYLEQLQASSKSMEAHRGRRSEHKKLTVF